MSRSWLLLLLILPGLSRGQDDCISTTAPGEHDFMCADMPVYTSIPSSCPESGCGLILEIHGDGGTGALQDAHLELARLGAAAGYILIAPTGGGFPARDDALMAIVRHFADRLQVDRRRIHLTGFSRGGFAAWRLVCEHADLFASAAPAAAGVASAGQQSCFSEGALPERRVPILQLIGLEDRNVPPVTQTTMRDLVIERWGLSGPELLSGDADHVHHRWTGQDGAVFEVFEHRYELPRGGGHCVPGSPAYDADRYAYGCEPPNAFHWGQEVLRFFEAHPLDLPP